MRYGLLVGLTLALALATNPAGAQDDFGDFGDFGTGFEVGAVEDLGVDLEAIKEETAQDKSPLKVTGFVKEDLGYSFAKKEPASPYLSKARTTLNLNLDYKPTESFKAVLNLNAFYDAAYGMKGTEEFTPELIESMEQEAEIKDAYLDYKLAKRFSVKAGRQIIAWGESQVSQLNDLANPRDNRELGIVDIEDARLPVTALKWTFDGEGFDLELASIHEFRPTKMPALGSEFDMFQGMRAMATLEEPTEPDFRPEVLLRAKWEFNGGDFSLIAGEVYEDVPYFEFQSFDGATQEITLAQKFARIQSVGMAVTKGIETWMLRGELAFKQGKMIPRKDMAEQLAANIGAIPPPAGGIYGADSGLMETSAQKDVMQAALAVEYSGFSDTRLSLELAADQIQDWDETLAQDEVGVVGTFMASYDALNATLHNRLFWFSFLGGNGDVLRLETSYDSSTPGLSYGGGLVFYQDKGEESMLFPFKDNDRLFASVKYYY